MLNSQNEYGSNACSTSEACSNGLDMVEKGFNVKPKALSLNLNSCPPVSPYSNPKNAAAAYEFGPFGTTGTLGHDQFLVDSNRTPKRSPKHLNSDDALAKKRVCRSNSNASTASGKGNSGPSVDRKLKDR